jgi:23S rRNA (cytosine1962-C5)-methyltransferase
MKTVYLKPGREKSLRGRHPWIFSGALESLPADLLPGETVLVSAAAGDPLAIGAVSPASQIAVRVWTFDCAENVDALFLKRCVQAAIGRRPGGGNGGFATAARLINAESDGLPGLIVDRYAAFLVCQFLSAGAEFHREEIVAALAETLAPEGIYERSDTEARGKEGLEPRTGVLHGRAPDPEVTIRLGDLQFLVDVRGGHKTGFYLDQAGNLDLVRRHSASSQVLNCYAYTGAFAVAALKGGARHVVNLDSSAPALAIAEKHVRLNGFGDAAAETVQGDVPALLRRYRDARRSFDMIVLDPPKFVAHAGQVERGARGYKDINLLAMKLLRPGGLLVTFSCSGHVAPDLFQKIVADAAVDAARDVRILNWLSQPPDHPVAVNFPQGRYLKGLLCRVE